MGDFAVHSEDHAKLGVVRLDHPFPSSVIGICTLRGKFQGKAVGQFIDTLVEDSSCCQVGLRDQDSLQDDLAKLATVGSNNS